MAKKELKFIVNRKIFSVIPGCSSVLFVWVGDIGLKNLVWLRFILFRVGWPPVKRYTGLYNVDNEELIDGGL